MNKPDWKDAPEWANWLAMDADKTWYWYAGKPELEGGMWRYSLKSPQFQIASRMIEISYKDTLEERPNV